MYFNSERNLRPKVKSRKGVTSSSEHNMNALSPEDKALAEKLYAELVSLIKVIPARWRTPEIQAKWMGILLTRYHESPKDFIPVMEWAFSANPYWIKELCIYWSRDTIGGQLNKFEDIIEKFDARFDFIRVEFGAEQKCKAIEERRAEKRTNGKSPNAFALKHTEFDVIAWQEALQKEQ
jgi:hypothetical protein